MVLVDTFSSGCITGAYLIRPELVLKVLHCSNASADSSRDTEDSVATKVSMTPPNELTPTSSQSFQVVEVHGLIAEFQHVRELQRDTKKQDCRRYMLVNIVEQ